MASYNLIQLKASDGTWADLIEAWREQCASQGEDFDEYASGTMAVLGSLAHGDEARAGVFGLSYDQSVHAICQANMAMLPGYDGPVLRVRMMTLAPDYDLGVRAVDEYARVIVRLLMAALGLSVDKYPCRHVKFHMRSPADRAFFSAVGDSLEEANMFESVQARGGWLYVTKR